MTAERPTCVVLGVIAMRDEPLGIERFLMTLRPQSAKRYPSRWHFPGGVIEHGEHPREALERELREELGASFEIGEMPFGVVSRVDVQRIGDGPDLHYMMLCYEAAPLEANAIFRPAAGECARLGWFVREAVYEMALRREAIPGSDETLAQLFQKRAGI